MGRPTKALISTDRAIEAALEIIDELGLDALSLGLVAERIGVRAPSLYYHFKDKAELLSSVAQRLLLDVEVAYHSSLPWEDQLIELCRVTRRTILLHPNAAALLLRYFPRNIMLPAYEFWVGKCPYPPAARLVVMEGSEKLTFGSALFAAAAQAYHIPSMPSVEAQDFPVVAETIAARGGEDEEGLFVETIKAFLDGIRARFPHQ